MDIGARLIVVHISTFFDIEEESSYGRSHKTTVREVIDEFVLLVFDSQPSKGYWGGGIHKGFAAVNQYGDIMRSQWNGFDDAAMSPYSWWIHDDPDISGCIQPRKSSTNGIWTAFGTPLVNENLSLWTPTYEIRKA